MNDCRFGVSPVNYPGPDAVSQRMKISAQNEKQVRLLFPKQLGQILGLDPVMIEKTYQKRTTDFQV